MGEEGRVGILMCAGCAFVCLLLFVTLALTQVAMQDRLLVSCADALAGWGQDVEVYEARGRTHGDRNGRRLSGRGRR